MNMQEAIRRGEYCPRCDAHKPMRIRAHPKGPWLCIGCKKPLGEQAEHDKQKHVEAGR